MNKSQPIGIFDSGIGGLTVANAVLKALPNEQLVYFGDTAHLPYGDKSPDLIKSYSKSITEFLLQHNCKAVLIACNTASSSAYELVKELTLNKAIAFNVIDPVVKEIVDKDYSKVGVIGTLGTIGSNVYYNKIKAQKKDCKVYSLATPMLASMVESGYIDGNISDLLIKEYLDNDILEDIEALILGCTHYPLIKRQIEQYYDRNNRNVQVLATNEITATYVNNVLSKEGLINDVSALKPHKFYVSDYTASFEQTTQLFYGSSVDLEKHHWE